MIRPIRWLLRIALGLFAVVIVVVVTAILARDTIFRHVLISRMRAATGMEVKIGSVHVGLLSPTMTIEDLKLYNTAAFGGSLCLDMPSLHLEYDPAAVHSGVIHLTLMRVSLSQIELVTDKHGRSNFDLIEKPGEPSASHTNSLNRINFGGIDTLNLRLGKFHESNLRSGTEVEMDFGMKNQVFHNVKSEADLTGVAVLLAMRGSSSTGHSGINLNELFNNLIEH
jgi:uncharacterized protein involved in outer membrane biogenesis